jgi:hypothetical protein
MNLPSSIPIIGLRGRLILTSPSSWSNLAMIKQRKEWRKIFHGGNIISALMSSFKNVSLHLCLHVVMPRKLLTP